MGPHRDRDTERGNEPEFKERPSFGHCKYTLTSEDTDHGLGSYV